MRKEIEAIINDGAKSLNDIDDDNEFLSINKQELSNQICSLLIERLERTQLPNKCTDTIDQLIKELKGGKDEERR